MVLLCPTGTSPSENISIIPALYFACPENEPGFLDWNLLPGEGNGPTLAWVIHNCVKLDSILMQSLSDQCIGSKVDARAIVHVEDHALEVTPHSLNNHCCPLPRNGIWIC